MILVFGGTTEGRRAAGVLEEAGSPFYYSTKTGEQQLTLHHGQRIDGAMDRDAMVDFCRQHDIRLIVDAAHPFASQLHRTIADVAVLLSLPVVRYERIYPPRDPDITWIDDYSEVGTVLSSFGGAGGGCSLLATTGVQSISKLKYLEQRGIRMYYRILPRESSVRLAHEQGATDDQLCFYEGNALADEAAEDSLETNISADAILLKESGTSGGFTEKVAAARAKGMRIIALKRPDYHALFTMPGFQSVDGPHGLRRAVERLLPDFFPLHSGLTTGTCATAAAVAATLQYAQRAQRRQRAQSAAANSSHAAAANSSLHSRAKLAYPLPFTLHSSLHEGSSLPNEVPVVLPDGETIYVSVSYGPDYAFVVKDAGDDPDVTDGIEIRATVEWAEEFTIVGGRGVGHFTLPGFDFPPGEAAINRSPREMIRQNVLAVLSNSSHAAAANSSLFTLHSSLKITITVPQGEEIARRTFNPRLGIEGGISIIGVSGIVKPFSEEAFIDSIRKCMEVAKASGTERVVINSGAKSERFVRALYPDLPRQAFVEYGNYIGATLTIAAQLGIRRVTLGVMIGKAVKLAAGHLDTHSRRTVMDKDFIASMLAEAHCTVDLSSITLARELWERIPADRLADVAAVIIAHCYRHCHPLLPEGELTILLISDEGEIYHG